MDISRAREPEGGGAYASACVIACAWVGLCVLRAYMRAYTCAYACEVGIFS